MRLLCHIVHGLTGCLRFAMDAGNASLRETSGPALHHESTDERILGQDRIAHSQGGQ